MKTSGIFLTEEELNKVMNIENEFDGVYWRVWGGKYFGTKEDMYNRLRKLKYLISELV